ncbi:MAG: VWA domain-containing protein [Solibacillus sp.]
MEHNIAVLYSRSIFQLSIDQRSRFNELIKLSKLLHDACTEGESLLPGMTNCLGDIWSAFYLLHPKFLAQASDIGALQYEFITTMMQTDDYTRWHQLTRGDELLSILTTLAIYEKLKEQKQSRSSFGQKSIKEQLKDMNMQQILSETTKRVKEQRQVIQMIGTADGKKMQQVTMTEQLTLAEQLQHNESLKKIAELTGRFKKIAQKKQKTKQRQTFARQNVTVGQEVARLLPIEMANFITPSSKLDFLRRYAEQQAFIFDTKGKDRRGRGPIILCMDESSSMTTIKEQSKAFCLALLMIARRQKRDFAMIPFASSIGDVQIFAKGKATTDDLIHLSTRFLGGGTNYEKPLRESLEILTRSEFKSADIIFVTDGSSFLPSAFIEEFNTIKKAKSFSCTAIVLTNVFNAVDLKVVNRFSDKVIEVNELFEADDVFAIT